MDNVSNGATENRINTSSLIHTGVREDAIRKVILVDEKRLYGITLSQFADYIAFVSVATPDISAEYGESDSIMALFSSSSDASKPAGLTTSDRIFLQALYGASASRTANQEKGELRKKLRHGDQNAKTEPAGS